MLNVTDGDYYYYLWYFCQLSHLAELDLLRQPRDTRCLGSCPSPSHHRNMIRACPVHPRHKPPRVTQRYLSVLARQYDSSRDPPKPQVTANGLDRRMWISFNLRAVTHNLQPRQQQLVREEPHYLMYYCLQS